MSFPTLKGGRRLLTGSTVAALTAGVLAIAPTAQAADPAPTPELQWKISEQFVAHFTPNPAFSPFTTLVSSDGATIDGTTKVTTFGNGVGTFDSITGATSVAYEGSVTGSFVTGTTAPGTLQYSLTLSDPSVIIEPNGAGRIEADVVWTVPGDAENPSGSSEDVVMTRFDVAASDWNTAGNLARLTATPDFLGVLPAGSDEALALGIPAGQPIDGGSFDREFLTALNSDLRAHFHLSGSATGDPRKPASPFTATITRAETSPLAVTNLTKKHGRKGSVSVTAPVPGTVTVTGIGSATATAADQTLNIAVPRNLRAGTRSYQVAFAPADARLMDSMPTTVTVKVTKSAAKKAKFKVKKKPTTKKRGKAVVRVPRVAGGAHPTGKVRVRFVNGKQRKVVTVKLAKGKRAVNVPKLAKGKWKVQVRYFGNVNYKPRKFVKAGTIRVTR